MQSQEHRWWGRASKAPVGQDMEDQSLLLQECPREGEGLIQCHKGSRAGGKPRPWSLDISILFLQAYLVTFLCLLGGEQLLPEQF